MAIASFVVQVAAGRLAEVEAAVRLLPSVDVCGHGDASSLVVVAEGHSRSLPGTEAALGAVPGVLSVSTAFLSIEDELEAAPAGA